MAPPFIYADHASTSFPTLFHPLARDASWGNPSNTHALGVRAHQVLEQERARWERLINAPPPAGATNNNRPRIIFTSGGTEGNNLVLQGGRWDYIITTKMEHSAVHRHVLWFG